MIIRAFERHKKQLDNIYSKLNKKSSTEFGIKNNISYKMLEQKLKKTSSLNKFYSSEKNRTINRENQIMSQKLKAIENRKNQLIINENAVSHQLVMIKNRLGMLKSIDEKRMKQQNFSIGKRFEMNSNPTINMKKLDVDFNNILNYKKLIKKFELPDIEEKAPKIVKRQLDISPYNRDQRISHENIIHTHSENYYKTMNQNKSIKNFFGNRSYKYYSNDISPRTEFHNGKSPDYSSKNSLSKFEIESKFNSG